MTSNGSHLFDKGLVIEVPHQREPTVGLGGTTVGLGGSVGCGQLYFPDLPRIGLFSRY